MAKARYKKVKDMRTVIRMGASASSLTATGAGNRISIELPSAAREEREGYEAREARIKADRILTEVAATVCELHGIRTPQLRVNGKFVKRGKPQQSQTPRRPTTRGPRRSLYAPHEARP